MTRVLSATVGLGMLYSVRTNSMFIPAELLALLAIVSTNLSCSIARTTKPRIRPTAAQLRPRSRSRFWTLAPGWVLALAQAPEISPGQRAAEPPPTETTQSVCPQLRRKRESSGKSEPNFVRSMSHSFPSFVELCCAGWHALKLSVQPPAGFLPSRIV